MRHGELLRFVASPDERETLDRIQAVMTLIEGHAEHVMDHAAPDFVPSLTKLRNRLEQRRRTIHPVARVLSKLLGLEMKLRQYELGKRFCDAVVATDGIEALNRAWISAEMLPSLDELNDPPAWVRRTAVPAQTR